VTLINPADDEELALTLNGKKKKLKLEDFTILGHSLQIPGRAIENSFKKFASGNKEVDLFISSSFLSQELKELYKKIWMEKQFIFA
jgi:serine/threonine-protein kinase HipA